MYIKNCEYFAVETELVKIELKGKQGGGGSITMISLRWGLPERRNPVSGKVGAAVIVVPHLNPKNTRTMYQNNTI